MTNDYGRRVTIMALAICLSACSSGPLKWNQSQQPAPVDDHANLAKPRASSYRVLIVPSGAIRTTYISDKTSTLGGVIGSMIVGPIAGAFGGLVGSTAGSTAAANAEENASQHIDSSDVTRAIEPIALPQFFARTLSDRLSQCGMQSTVYPITLNPGNPDWSTNPLVIPQDLMRTAEPYRFIIEANVLGIQVRDALSDTTLEGNAYARVYETQSLKQIGRYASKTGSSGSVTLDQYNGKSEEQNPELQTAAKDVARYLAGGMANDMCAIMKRF